MLKKIVFYALFEVTANGLEVNSIFFFKDSLLGSHPVLVLVVFVEVETDVSLTNEFRRFITLFRVGRLPFNLLCKV
jgi:hypothetical protein